MNDRKFFMNYFRVHLCPFVDPKNLLTKTKNGVALRLESHPSFL